MATRKALLESRAAHRATELEHKWVRGGGAATAPVTSQHSGKQVNIELSCMQCVDYSGTLVSSANSTPIAKHDVLQESSTMPSNCLHCRASTAYHYTVLLCRKLYTLQLLDSTV
jgi:hypothetical protein